MGGPWTYDGGHHFAMNGPDKDFYDELEAGMGASIVGRGMYDAAGAWGGTNPFAGPLFVLTHRLQDQPAAASGFTFVSGLDEALVQATGVAGGKDVSIGGVGNAIRQALAAGLVEWNLVLSTAPVILGAGKRLFDGFDLRRRPRNRQDGQLDVRHARALRGQKVATSRTPGTQRTGPATLDRFLRCWLQASAGGLRARPRRPAFRQRGSRW